MLFPAIFINVIQLTTKSLYFWDSLYLRKKFMITTASLLQLLLRFALFSYVGLHTGPIPTLPYRSNIIPVTPNSPPHSFSFTQGSRRKISRPLCSYISERFARVLLSDALHTANAHGLHPFPVLPSLFHKRSAIPTLVSSAPLAPAFPRASSDTSQGTPYGSGSATRNGSRASNAPVSLRSFISVIKLPLPVASYGVSEIKSNDVFMYSGFPKIKS